VAVVENPARSFFKLARSETLEVILVEEFNAVDTEVAATALSSGDGLEAVVAKNREDLSGGHKRVAVANVRRSFLREDGGRHCLELVVAQRSEVADAVGCDADVHFIWFLFLLVGFCWLVFEARSPSLQG